MAGNIQAITAADGTYTSYQYDRRYRLTRAERENPNDTIVALSTYAYDDGDNLLSKTEPFLDDFNDGNMTGWTTYSAIALTSGAVKNTGVVAGYYFNCAIFAPYLEDKG